MSNYSVPEEVVFRQLGDETVLVHLGSSEIFKLNETGTRLWELLSQGLAVASIQETMAAEYDVAVAELSAEIESLLASLSEAGLLVATDDP